MTPKIDKEFQSLIQPLTKDEYAQLEENMITDGCRDPLVLWGDILIDGHNRLKICQKNNITYQTVQKEFDDREYVKIWIIKNQLGRRNLIPFQRIELTKELKPLIAAKAKERMLAGKKDPTQKPAEGSEGETREELAKLAGVSHDTFTKGEYILENASPEQIERVRKGGKGNSVNAIHAEIRLSEDKAQGITEKRCIECGETKLLEDFEADRKRCKMCRRKTKNGRSDTDKTMGIVEQSIARISDSSREIVYTIEDLEDEFGAIVDYFCRNSKDCLTDHSSVLNTAENKQKIIAVLSEAETTIKTLKGLLI